MPPSGLPSFPSPFLSVASFLVRKAFGNTTTGAARSILTSVGAGAGAGDDDDEEESKAGPSTGGGRILGGGGIGGGPIVVPGTMEEMRHQLHSKWEAEKKLQKRVATLEKRLQEKVQEVEDTQAQLRKQKELTQQYQTTAQREKERSERLVKLSNPKQMGGGGGESVLAMHGQEELQSRIFQLEEENDGYKKKLLVQFPNEVGLHPYSLCLSLTLPAVVGGHFKASEPISHGSYS
jgi:hypothetical protein